MEGFAIECRVAGVDLLVPRLGHVFIEHRHPAFEEVERVEILPAPDEPTDFRQPVKLRKHVVLVRETCPRYVEAPFHR